MGIRRIGDCLNNSFPEIQGDSIICVFCQPFASTRCLQQQAFQSQRKKEMASEHFPYFMSEISKGPIHGFEILQSSKFSIFICIHIYIAPTIWQAFSHSNFCTYECILLCVVDKETKAQRKRKRQNLGQLLAIASVCHHTHSFSFSSQWVIQLRAEERPEKVCL